ncbi:MAG: hypothetical protein JWP31_2223 [Aeromicrobium sp.]|nr:hypothetical protein [Aeromicrobium sp.]
MPVIRQIGPDQWADWRLLRRRSLIEDSEAFASSVSLPAGTHDTEVLWRARIVDGPCFVAYDGDRPVGMVAGRLTESGAELISMWVAPEARRAGIGSDLIDAVVAWNGRRPLSLRVMDGNHPAIAAYERHGFVLVDGSADAEGCRRMTRPADAAPVVSRRAAATAPTHRLVESAPVASAADQFFRRFRRVGLAGVIAATNRVLGAARPPGEAATEGFTWQGADATTDRWWPQGISTSADAYGADSGSGTFEGREVVITSWYAHGRWRRWLGSRLSVIDLSGSGTPRYRHVLLVDPQRRWGFHRLRAVRVHAGGIVWYGDHLFVAGSSSGIRVFRLDDVVRVRNRFRTRGYRFVLPQSMSYAADHDEGLGPMTYSFVSLDRAGDQDHLVAGEYGRKGGSHRLMRYPIDRTTQLLQRDDRGRAYPSDLHDAKIARMQGATLAAGTWVITASRGEDVPGDLWVGQPGDYRCHRGVLPTGIEDITYWPQRHQLWTLTEWPGRRWLVAIDVARHLPKPASGAVPRS